MFSLLIYICAHKDVRWHDATLKPSDFVSRRPSQFLASWPSAGFADWLPELASLTLLEASLEASWERLEASLKAHMGITPPV